MKNNIIISSAAAFNAVLAELQLRTEDIEFYESTRCGDLYELIIFTPWMRYDCFVDAFTAEVLGLSSQPMLLCTTDRHEAKFEYLRGNSDSIA